MSPLPINPASERHRKIRECRSLLLEMINATFPGSLPEQLLLDVCLDLSEPIADDYVLRDLAYMAARGLLESVMEERYDNGQRKKVRCWKLSARGVTFVERSKPWQEIEAL